MAKMILTIACALAVATVQADNCAEPGTGYQMKTTMPSNCNGHRLECTVAGGCDCGNCCEPQPGTCLALRTSGTGCGDSAYVRDSTKDPASATTATYKANCCVAKQVCTAITCAQPYKDKSDKGTITCNGATCANTLSARECCDPDTAGKCHALRATACPADHIFNSAASLTVATAGNYATTCCMATPTTGTTTTTAAPTTTATPTPATCQAFKARAPIAAGAEMQQVHLTAFLLAAGLFVFGI